VDAIIRAIEAGASTAMTKVQFLENEIARWILSSQRIMQLDAERYYKGYHVILDRKRMIIGETGELVPADNLPNNKIVDNQYAKAVDQKTNYLFAKPFTVETKNKKYGKALADYTGHKFRRKIKRLGRTAINQGIAWLHPYYTDEGELKFKVFEGYEVLPFWSDSEHTELHSAIRLYSVEAYEGTTYKEIKKVEYYSSDGIERYVYDGGHLILDVEDPSSTHFMAESDDGVEILLNWDRIPLIPFKFDDLETSLLSRVKSLQDGLNTIASNYMNDMEEGPRNTILVLENYDGTNLGEFRHNLAQYGAVKVRSVDGAKGDVRTLSVEVNAENYKVIYELLKNALIENAKALDSKSDKTGQANEMNILSMYSELDIDANGTELEFQASFEELFYFIDMHLANTGMGDFSNEQVNILFNRDIQISESDTVKIARESKGIISDETIVANHPWVMDKDEEMARIKKEKDTYMSEDPFRQNTDTDDDNEEDDGGGVDG
jgi:SPP1 family phage portal protein